MCERKACVSSYHVICKNCAKPKDLCQKCMKPREGFKSGEQTAEERNIDNTKFDAFLANMSERERRSVQRAMDKGTLVIEDDDGNVIYKGPKADVDDDEEKQENDEQSDSDDQDDEEGEEDDEGVIEEVEIETELEIETE
eukprot:TRINITY_DN1173_c1_g1_i1.p1 TRINITY_DN1173_c1_g1~~TRINITY_DN1173_c1_g1_i1.p1  ORF type:complete len:140 (+),score=45.11 TRINITY_DN1173_c1_g1_i1:481-900(+)